MRHLERRRMLLSPTAGQRQVHAAGSLELQRPADGDRVRLKSRGRSLRHVDTSGVEEDWAGGGGGEQLAG